MQLNHYNTNFKQQTFPITIVCQNVTNAPNIGSLFRTSDAFGIKELVFTGTEIPLGRKMTKTSRATEKVVNYQVVEDAFGFISNLKNEGHQIISLEITDNSVALHKFSFNLKAPIVLVIGDENFGVSDQILSISDAIIHIDMFGQNSSMNVVQATSIALYEMTKQIMAK
ncbi:tRNA/rRNA methyltransferase SpoU [Mesoflavibacter sp. HG96]|uniref:TrmH family RNA methyltransferase n=1 Tax=Mesoflavibacter profundi TaxID=2708110 RepID=A0ABT4RXQ3_9FLAO|nr:MULTISPECIES: TrmH family RNA methyltransferase [Mesoflavibacter]MDA0176540.1 TrmH family RNA methyltransferase [Mesoflavibacter profundi]QIJ90195.1 tRNA/rRNA methyltransferase SpoU [Mesoflavibacter sp. HG96]QIJ92923.1 tRNA/rRNA methyltransferase SpoU [Mesoflavibacter sp. HG37]